MKTTLKEIVNISRGLAELGRCVTLENPKISYRVAKLRRDIEAELALFDRVRRGLVEKYGTPEPGGEPRVKPGTPEHREFVREVDDLLAQEVDVFWVPLRYSEFNPGNKLKLSEDFVLMTFALWAEEPGAMVSR